MGATLAVSTKSDSETRVTLNTGAGGEFFAPIQKDDEDVWDSELVPGDPWTQMEEVCRHNSIHSIITVSPSAVKGEASGLLLIIKYTCLQTVYYFM